MKQDDLLKVKILDQGMNGEGIAKVDGFVIFVPFALKDEFLEIKITYLKKDFAYAKIVNIIEKSKHRITAPCPYFRQCGGCSLQHIDYAEQLNIKKTAILNTFKRNLNIDVKVEDIVCGKNNFYYRNKVQLPVGIAKNNVAVGFYKAESHRIIPLKSCILHGEWANGFIDAFLSYANDLRIEPYDEDSHNGILRHLILRKTGNTVSVVVVINKETLPHSNILIKYLKKVCIPFNLHVNINRKNNNVILGERFILLYGKDTVSAKIGDISIELSPQAFLQINDEVRDLLYANVLKKLDKDQDTVIDVYSGIGIMSNILAKNSKTVYGIEIIKEAVDNANKLAELNGNNIINICGDAGKELPKLIKSIKEKDGDRKITVVIDPPRKGIDKGVIDGLILSGAEKIIYISCNPATLTRDLKHLIDDYEITEILPHEMFPQTPHIEILCCLTLKETTKG